jgi:hypothetical protein
MHVEIGNLLINATQTPAHSRIHDSTAPPAVVERAQYVDCCGGTLCKANKCVCISGDGRRIDANLPYHRCAQTLALAESEAPGAVTTQCCMRSLADIKRPISANCYTSTETPSLVD